MKLILGSIVMAFVIAITMSYAYGEEVPVKVPFDTTGFSCTLSEELIYDCRFYGMADPVFEFDNGSTITVEVEPVEDEPEITDEATVVVKPTLPKTPAEKMIDELTAKMEKDGFLPSHEDQLRRALLSLQEECELGTLEGAPIQTYKLFLVATFEPYTHTDLGTQYILKEIELAIQECKSQKILREKVLGAQYLNLPGQSDVTPPHIFRDNFEGLIWDELEGMRNPTYAFAERHMTEFNKEKSTQFAEQFKCSAIGKSMGYCRDPFGGAPPPTDVTTISQTGKALLKEYKAFQETGITKIPVKDPEAEFDPTTSLDQYIDAYRITDEQLKEWYESRQP